jgi:rhodanese-related sulfurtransferase
MEIERIDPVAARAHVAGGQALLVCAYEDPEKCRRNHLEGALTLQELHAIEDELPRDREIIFYCA